MKQLIKTLLKKRLNEVSITTHTFDRAEERVWGNERLTNGEINKNPPTINKDAWDHEIDYNKITVPTSRGLKEIPATDMVRDIMSKLRFAQNDLKVNVTLNSDESVNLVIFTSYKEYRGGGIWGNVLTGVVRPKGDEGSMVTIQWQNTTDLSTLRSGKFGTPKYIVNIDYLLKQGITELNDENIASSALYPKQKSTISKPKVAPVKSEKYKKIKLVNGSEVRFFIETNRFETLNGEPLDANAIFDDLTPEMQDQVINAMS